MKKLLFTLLLAALTATAAQAGAHRYNYTYTHHHYHYYNNQRSATASVEFLSELAKRIEIYQRINLQQAKQLEKMLSE